jgi:TRAP-type C4-dicarboxylate transport system substrate-binding protein
MVIMNKNVWNEMPADVQDAIMSVSGGSLAAQVGRDVFDRAKLELADIAKSKGVTPIEYTVPQDEIDKWIAAAGQPIWDSWVKTQTEKGLTSAQDIRCKRQLAQEYSN